MLVIFELVLIGRIDLAIVEHVLVVDHSHVDHEQPPRTASTHAKEHHHGLAKIHEVGVLVEILLQRYGGLHLDAHHGEYEHEEHQQDKDVAQTWNDLD